MIGAGEDAKDKFVRGATAWILQRGALGGLMSEYAQG
jgi:hypothetical protein